MGESCVERCLKRASVRIEYSFDGRSPRSVRHYRLLSDEFEEYVVGHEVLFPVLLLGSCNQVCQCMVSYWEFEELEEVLRPGKRLEHC